MAKEKKNVIRPEEALANKIEDKVDFDVWFALREAKIPKQHHKEIIKADFRGQGLGHFETMQVFDKALKRYGVKI
jgi:hypothetical protein